MKYYETSFEEYVHAKKQLNLHPELEYINENLPENFEELKNIIIYGSTGTGKYSIALDIINKYSNNQLKFDKRTIVVTDKQNYNLKMSDIHYEIDISLLGCNSKQLWHEIFLKIVDIVSVQKEKQGIILCKNFHSIHSELLDIFYSYIQQHNHSQANIKIVFILITEQLSFFPKQLIETSQIINVKRPSKELHKKYIDILQKRNDTYKKTQENYFKNNSLSKKSKNSIIENIPVNTIINLKELHAFPLIEKNKKELPEDHFNIICDKIIRELNNCKNIEFTAFRDCLYDILTYNLDLNECLWYVLNYYVTNNLICPEDISEILAQSFSFLKYYNNNYRPIYHLESIFFTILQKIKHNDIKNEF